MCQNRRPCCTSCFVQWAEFVNQNTNSFFRAVSLSFLLQFTAIQNGTWPTDYRRTNCFNAWFVMWCVYLVPIKSLHYLHFKFFFPICFFFFLVYYAVSVSVVSVVVCNLISKAFRFPSPCLFFSFPVFAFSLRLGTRLSFVLLCIYFRSFSTFYSLTHLIFPLIFLQCFI